jgi:hypothetical protein
MVIVEGCKRSAGKGVSLERAKQERKGFEGAIGEEVTGIVHGLGVAWWGGWVAKGIPWTRAAASRRQPKNRY